MKEVKEKNKIILNKKTKNGSVLIELLFYIGLFAITSIVVINAMIAMTKSFKETALQSEFGQSGTIMERMSREIRSAHSINSISSYDLRLNTKDSNGVDKIVEVVFVGPNIQLLENNIFVGNLNTPNIIVNGIAFSQITTTKGKAVRIILSIQSTKDAMNRTQNFYDTIVLRGDYQ
jgi:hypothetical protein